MSDIGSFQIFLKLIKIPYDLDWMGNELIIFRRIFSPQVKSSYSRISHYTDGMFMSTCNDLSPLI